MEKLNIKIVSGREGLAAAYSMMRGFGFFNMNDPFFDGAERSSAIARLEGKAVGFWDGMINGEEVPLDFGIERPFFYSKMIFVLGKFRRMGFGEQIKQSQLEFAKDSGCRSLYCRAEDNAHKDSLGVQKRLGARVRRGDGNYFECCYDLDKLNL